MKYFICFCLLPFSVLSAHTPASFPPQLEGKIEVIKQATMQQDYDKLVTLTHPEIVKRMGGPKVLSNFMKQAIDILTQQGYSISGVEVLAPSAFYQAGNTELVLIPTQITVNGAAGKVVRKSHLIASREVGRGWYFIDSNVVKEVEELQGLFTDLPTDFKLPRQSFEFQMKK